MNKASYREFIIALLDTLEAADFLKSRTVRNSENKEVKVYQLRLDKVVWLRGDRETVAQDVVKQRSYKAIQLRPNRFFQRVYQLNFADRKRLIGGDHTGQLSNEQRIDREERFRADWPETEKVMGESVSALFCHRRWNLASTFET